MANGALGALSAWLENNKRVARRQLGDLVNSPNDFGRMQAARFREDQQKYMEDPASGLDFVGGPLGALAGVIKNKGGNWLTGSVENALKGLRKYAEPYDMELMRRNLATPHTDLEGVAALRELLPNMGPARRTVEGDITRLEQRAAADQGRWQRDLVDMERNANLNSWIEGPLTKYIKTQMATPEDPVRALIEQGIFHDQRLARLTADDVYTVPQLRYLREDAGFGQMGKSPAAQEWENTADAAARRHTAQSLRDMNPIGAELAGQREASPWLAQLAGDAPVHAMPSASTGMLGFKHLTDELRNALNPESGLPRNLLLRSEQLKQMGMEKAVRHVDSINKWRAAQKAAADQELAGKAIAVREYAENNPKGLRWVELGKDTPELEKQLKYEGDTMGHCVGGYCPDVLEGRSRIFSLRDAKGEPHVTVEVQPKGAVFSDIAKYIGTDEAERLLDKGVTLSEMIKGIPDFQRPLMIKQIKGKQNRAPNEEYLPFVQDFVRNSPIGAKWGEVGDFGNTGLKKVADFDHIFNREIAPLLGKDGERIGRHQLKRPEQEYMTPAELREWVSQQRPDDVNDNFWEGLINSIK